MNINEKVQEITLPASLESYDELMAFLESVLEEADCPMKVQISISIAVEEIFTNVAQYAYCDEDIGGKGIVIMQITELEDPKGIRIVLEDHGIPFNPLEKEDPDISQSAEMRDIGGLGIYMVKKSMDMTSYHYADNTNIFCMEKYW